MTEKWKVKTDALKGFEIGDVIEKFNDRYGNEDAVVGGYAIIIDLFESMPDWFEKIDDEPKHWPGRYKPMKNKNYFVRSDNTDSGREGATNFNFKKSLMHRQMGICCQDNKETEFIRRQQTAYLEIIDLIHESNHGWRPDWKDGNEVKYEFFYNGFNVDINETYGVRCVKSELMMKSRLIADKIIGELGEDKIKFALWEIE